MDMEKTAVTVLQELMVKLGDTPDYECIAQSGPQHLAMFQYRCQARGVTVLACARSKKEAKQEAARAMLLQLAARGHPVPAPYARASAASCSSSSSHTAPSGAGAGAGAGADRADGGGGGGMSPVSAPVGAHSYVALLKDLCEEYRLPAVDYELVGDTGPPHCRRFTVRARVCSHERLATATTKKAARQMAAEQLYTYLRENLARVTKDFDEKEALVRVHEKAMQRYTEVRDETVWRPDLGQRVSEYHRGLLTHIDEDKRAAARELLAAPALLEGADGGEERLAGAARALGLEAALKPLPAEGGGLWLAALERAAPPIVVAARSREDAVTRALKYLRLALSLDD